ncbi:MAG: methionine biosynthesis protein MetW, partial [Candidatus Omnitrophota bacterium]
RGRAPVTESLPYSWYETPNLRSLSIYDFIDYCKTKQIKIEKKIYLGEKRKVFILPNVFASLGILVIKR